MAELTLWHVPQSRSMRSLWLLHEIGVDFHVEILDFFDGSMRGPRYGVITPVGRVPALQDGAVILRESGAITEWLCETRAPHLTRAPGTPARAAWLNWLHFAETLGQPYCGSTSGFETSSWFGEASRQIRSQALIAMRNGGGTIGMIALGSEDAQRFYAGMGTLYLERLGEMASAALARVLR